MPVRGWDTVTTPGAVAGWVALSGRFGIANPVEHHDRLVNRITQYRQYGRQHRQ